MSFLWFVGLPVCRYVRLWVYRCVGLSLCRSVGLSVWLSVGAVGQSVGLSLSRSVGLLVCRTVGLSACRSVDIGSRACFFEFLQAQGLHFVTVGVPFRSFLGSWARLWGVLGSPLSALEVC